MTSKAEKERLEAEDQQRAADIAQGEKILGIDDKGGDPDGSMAAGFEGRKAPAKGAQLPSIGRIVHFHRTKGVGIDGVTPITACHAAIITSVHTPEGGEVDLYVFPRLSDEPEPLVQQAPVTESTVAVGTGATTIPGGRPGDGPVRAAGLAGNERRVSYKDAGGEALGRYWTWPPVVGEKGAEKKK